MRGATSIALVGTGALPHTDTIECIGASVVTLTIYYTRAAVGGFPRSAVAWTPMQGYLGGPAGAPRGVMRAGNVLLEEYYDWQVVLVGGATGSAVAEFPVPAGMRQLTLAWTEQGTPLTPGSLDVFASHSMVAR